MTRRINLLSEQQLDAIEQYNVQRAEVQSAAQSRNVSRTPSKINSVHNSPRSSPQPSSKIPKSHYSNDNRPPSRGPADRRLELIKSIKEVVPKAKDRDILKALDATGDNAQAACELVASWTQALAEERDLI